MTDRIDNFIPVTWTERSLGTHLGQRLMSDPAVAINELVANAWDAYVYGIEIIGASDRDHRRFLV